MTVVAEGRVATADPQRYLESLCRQFSARADAKPENDARVERNGPDATIDFGWARYEMTAGPTALALRVEATDDQALRQASELLRRHLEAHARDEPITLTWDRQDAPIADTDADMRDTMRGFHARMRTRRHP